MKMEAGEGKYHLELIEVDEGVNEVEMNSLPIEEEEKGVNSTDRANTGESAEIERFKSKERKVLDLERF